LFWLLAARWEETGDVGRASALFQSVLFLTFISSLGLPIALARFGGDPDDGPALFASGVALRAIASFTAVAVFLVVLENRAITAPIWTAQSLLGPAAFGVVAVGVGLASLVEVRLITMRRWGWTIVRAALPAVIRLPLLYGVAVGAPAPERAFALFLIAAGPIALSGYVGWLALHLSRDRERAARASAPPRGITRFAMVNWAGSVATEGPIFAVPFVVALAVGSVENAAFYVAWSFGAIAFVLPQMVAQVVLSEASQSGDTTVTVVRGLRLALAVTMLAAVAAQLGSGWLADLYGPGYGLIADQLPLLVASSIGWSYAALGLVSARLRDAHREVVVVSVVFLLATMVPVIALVSSQGPAAATWSWLVGNSAAAAVTTLLAVRARVPRSATAPHPVLP
jgi:hypothetical protein